MMMRDSAPIAKVETGAHSAYRASDRLSGGYIAFGCWLLLVCASGGAVGRSDGTQAGVPQAPARGTGGVGGADGSGGAARESRGRASGREGGGGAGSKVSSGGSAGRIDRVFVIMEENHP